MMGKYINTNSKGELLPAKGKLQALIADGATECEAKIGAVCVVSNGAFDAAAWLYNERELKEFTQQGDFRAKRFLEYEHAESLAK